MGTIAVHGLGKAYRQYPNRWSRLAEWVSPGAAPRHQLKWVLRDVSFDVSAGEAVGVVGMNGAGKSTLLKLIVGTAQATTGSVSLQGRVAALLELGMGFHPDANGRQNALMAGQLLGIGTSDIHALMPEIASFAEIGEYMDQPVRVYSSGMQVRLAFAVATAVRPDILIVDEALSVGDAYFQHKSFERIRQFRKQGTTLLLVSHDRAAIASICDRALLLNDGSLVQQGRPEDVLDYYNALIADRENAKVSQAPTLDGRLQTVSGTGEARVEEIQLLDREGKPVDTLNVGQPVTLRVKVRVHAPLPRLVLGYMIKDRLGQPMYGTNTHYLDRPLLDVSAGDTAEFRFSFPANLGEGHYSIATALTRTQNHLDFNYEWRDLALVFNVINMNRTLFTGTSWIEPELEIVR